MNIKQREMTPDELNRWIAEKIMKWDYDPLGGMLDDQKHPAWIMEDSSWIREEDWNPAKRIDHAMMALEKFPSWELAKNDFGEYLCTVWLEPSLSTNESDMFTGGYNKVLSLAICLALYEAGKEVG